MTISPGSLRMGMIAAMLVLGSVAACAPSSTVPPAASASGTTGTSATTTAPTATSATATTTAPATTTATTTSCAPVATGSASVTATPGTDVARPTLTGVTAATAPCGDRVIFEVAGVSSVGYRIGYVAELLGIGSGLPIEVAGATVLVVDLEVPAYNDAGQATYEPKKPLNLVEVAGLTSVRQVAWAGSFEGHSLIGIGVDRVRPYSVTVVAGTPTRVIVEIAP